MEERKEFVSHPFYQQYLWKKMMGDGTSRSSRNKRAMLPKVLKPFWHCLYGPYVLLLFFFYPTIIILDLFRNADILLVSKTELKKINGDGYQENQIFSPSFG